MTGPGPDRGLLAVRRVREARERDSRVGLQQALALLGSREAAAAAAQERLLTAPGFGSGTAGDFLVHTTRMRALADEVGRATQAESASRTVAEEARRHWGQDRRRVRTVDLLLDRRADERRRERVRREAAELDDLAAQGWLRSRRPLEDQEGSP